MLLYGIYYLKMSFMAVGSGTDRIFCVEGFQSHVMLPNSDPYR